MRERAICLSFPLGMVLLLSSFAVNQARDWFSFNYQEQEWYINTTALTVSSITYNPSSKYSDWVPRLFGEHAIFHNRTFAKKAGASLSPEEKSDRSRIFRDHFQLPPEAILPSCSFEMMGYAMVDFDHPISHYYMNTAPSIGVGTLSFLNGNDKKHDQQPTDVWKCYYRAMYEYSAKKLLLLPVVHWPVFIYCPAPRHDQSCLNIHEWYKRTMIERVMEANVSSSSTENLMQRLQFTDPLFNNFQLYQQLIQATIGSMTLPARLDIHLMHGKWTTNMDLDLMNIVRKPKSRERAICAVIPYTATDPGRRDINDGMTFDFIRYYNRLGFKVVIYDRDGINYDNIMHGPYSQLQGDDPKRFDLLYYNFTVLQRLIPGIAKFEADNVDSIKLSKVVVRGDIDKRLTYTYCRTHLRQTYGIEDVLVVDFDEFLFCPRASATADGQRQYLDEYFQHMRDQGIEQLFVKQRVLVPATPSNNMTDCLLSQVSQAATMHAALTQSSLTSTKRKTAESVPSIFNCLAPFHYGVKMFFDKAVHFGHACPYTSFHFSAYLRFVDCYVNSFQSSSRVKRHYHLGGCSLIHITSRPNHYNRSHPFTSQEVMQRPNELVHILREPWTNPTHAAATKQPSAIDSDHRIRVHNSGHNLHLSIADQAQHQLARSLVTHV